MSGGEFQLPPPDRRWTATRESLSRTHDADPRRFNARMRAAGDLARGRIVFAAACFSLLFMVLTARLVDLSVLRNAEEPSVAAAPSAPEVNIIRGDITDRNGELVAATLATQSVYVDARHVIEPEETATKLAQVLPELNRQELLKDLTSGKSFIWIKRNLTPRQQQQVTDLGIPSLHFIPEGRRIYPHGPLLAHVLGFVDIDNKGIAGIERRFDHRLSDPQKAREPLRLAIDVRVQHTLRDELLKGIADFNAIGGMGVVLDVRSGEVIAMVSLPDFDPNEPATANPENRFNRATLGAYEPGSTFKTFNTAMVLDNGIARLTDRFDARAPIQISRFQISDTHPKARWMTVAEVYAYSSNIGSARMAMAAGRQLQKDFLKKFGMLERSPIELPEVGDPLWPRDWRDINAMTIAFGHGISVTPMNLAAGTAAIVNGGRMIPPTLLYRDPAAAVTGTQVISASTSNTMRGLMRLVVAEGTGKKAGAEGYDVGGKTGTAEKVGEHGGYQRKALLSSFDGVFPMSDPRYVVLAMIDEPKGNKSSYGYATGGWTAAPVVSRTIERIAPMLGVEPDLEPEPTDPLISVAFQP